MSQNLKEQLEQARVVLAQNPAPDINTQFHQMMRTEWQLSLNVLDSILHDMSRPFDPTECGFQWQEDNGDMFGHWKSAKGFKMWMNNSGTITVKGLMGWSIFSDRPWPSSQFAGEQLLITLGVVEK